MDKEGTAIFVAFAVFGIKGIDFVTTLLQAGDLIKGNRVTHARLTLAVRQISVTPYAVLRILDDDAHFGALAKQIACQAKDDVIGILILMKLMPPHAADGTGIRTAMSTHEIETGSGQPVGCDCHITETFAQQWFAHGLATA